MWCIYKMEYYYSAIENEILPFATIQMAINGIILSEISQRKWLPVGRGRWERQYKGGGMRGTNDYV